MARGRAPSPAAIRYRPEEQTAEQHARRLINLVFADRFRNRRHGHDPSGAASNYLARVWPRAYRSESRRGFSVASVVRPLAKSELFSDNRWS